MPPYLVITVWATLHAVAVGLALWRGGWAERTAIGAALAAWAASVVVTDNQQWMRPQYAVLLVDIAFLAVLGFIGVRSLRLWALAAAGCQLGAVMLHLTFALNARGEAGSGRGYLAAELILSTLVFASIFTGVVQAATARRVQDSRA